jgi:SAM-dependent methyltransferase
LMRVDLVKPPVAQALAAAGCRTVWIGAESGSQPILDAMGKGTSVAQIHAARRVLGENGIKVGFFLQFGYPGETRDDVECTLRMLRAALPDEVGVSVSYPLPGTRFYEQVKSQLGQKQNWVDSADLALLYEGPFPQPFYRTLYAAVHNEFRMRRASADLRTVLRRPARWRPRHLRLGAAVAWRWLNWQRARLTLDHAARLPARTSQPAGPSVSITSADGPQLLATRQAFDSVAGDYDGPRGNNALVQRMREQMWRTLATACPSGSRLLDLGCGTGLDAVYLAQHGYEVVAADWSPEMVARAERRAAETGMSHRVSVRTAGIQDLAALHGERFDGLYSDLGPLNCVPDLGAAPAACAALLNPHGKMVVSVMGRSCPWENLYYGLRGELGRARLRLARGAVPVNLNGHTVWTRYYAPREFYAAFAKQFVLTDYQALGLFLPPPYLVRFYERWKAFGKLLGWLDDRLGGLPLLRDSGDHFLMVLTKRD